MTFGSGQFGTFGSGQFGTLPHLVAVTFGTLPCIERFEASEESTNCPIFVHTRCHFSNNFLCERIRRNLKQSTKSFLAKERNNSVITELNS